MLAISPAAAIHLILLSADTLASGRCFSALKMAAWWRQMVEVCKHMFMNMMFGSPQPSGRRRLSGSAREVLSKMLSSAMCLRQNAPLRSSSSSLAVGRWRCVKLRPKRQASTATAPKDERLEAPPGCSAASMGMDDSGVPRSKASSLLGRFDLA